MSTLFFPPPQPLRAGFDRDVRRPSIVATYQRARNGRLVLVAAQLPKSPVKFSFGTRTKPQRKD